MIEHLNIVRKEHIITIEDPIEFVFEQKNCLVSQRELGTDTLSYANAMRSAMREDPDIIFV
jgi:twitching motility protein PilT